MLEKINSVKDLKALNIDELKLLDQDIKNVLINKLTDTGGHLGPNLGITELTIALHYVFNSPVDKFVFDVSHQTYTHKILTGRKDAYISKEKYGSVSGFTTPSESEHDLFKIGHTSTSISLALGLAYGRDINKGKENIIAIIGDGSLSGGEAFEGLDNAALLKSNFIIIVNDNEMSIASNVGGIYKSLEDLRNSNGKSENNFFKTLGFEYIYEENGNDIESLISLFRKIKDIDHPLIVHIHTEKGNGYKFAVDNKELTHYYTPPKFLSKHSVAGIMGEYLVEKVKEDDKILIVNAATPIAVGFTPERRQEIDGKFIDVGICEEHAIGFISGLAKSGIKPIMCVMSSFVQRCYDQLNQDLAMNNSPAKIIIYNGTIAGGDCTHVGMFDIGLVNNIPSIVCLSPMSINEMKKMIDWMISYDNHPVIIRSPVAEIEDIEEIESNFDASNFDKYQIIYSGSEIAILALGSAFGLGKEVYDKLKEKGLNPTLINPRIYSSLDRECLDNLLLNHNVVVTIENGVRDGGWGNTVSSYFGDKFVSVLNYGADKLFNDLKKKEEIIKDCRYNADDIVEDIEKSLF